MSSLARSGSSLFAAARSHCYGYLDASSTRLSGSLENLQAASRISRPWLSSLNFKSYIHSDIPRNFKPRNIQSDTPRSFEPTNIHSDTPRNFEPRNIHSDKPRNFDPRNIYSDTPQNFEPRNNFQAVNFVRGIIEQDGNDMMFRSQYQKMAKHNADFVHIKLMRNNTFVTVTDSKGNTKLKASAGRLEEMKGGPKLSRYAAEATAEHVGRESRRLGLKSVIMRVKGFTYFKKKRQAIMSWREGFTDSKGGRSPIVYLEDVTRKPHNGCRLPKQRRV